MDAFIEACCGSAAQFFTTAVLFPLDIVKTRMQLANTRERASMWQVAQQIMKRDGVAGLWGAGLRPKLTQATAQKFTFFYIFSIMMSRAKKRAPHGLSTIATLAVGYIAAMLNTLLTLPLEVASNCVLADSTGCTARRGLLQTMVDIHDRGGMAALFRGVSASFVLCLNPSVSFGLFERLKSIELRQQLRKGVPAQHVALTTAQAFWFGAVAKAVATLGTFPMIRAKLLVQTASNFRTSHPPS